MLLQNASRAVQSPDRDAGENALSSQWIEWAVACSALDPGCAFAVALHGYRSDAISYALPNGSAHSDTGKESP